MSADHPQHDATAWWEDGPGRSGAALAEQQACWARGERVSVEQMLDRHPELRGNAPAILELLVNEAALREQLGETPRLEEFKQRFPQLAGRLERHWPLNPTLRSAGPDIQARGQAAAGVARVGRYSILALLGKGGMGVAYRAWDPQLRREVALKMIKGDDVGAETLARFRTEASAIAQVRHPHIVEIYDLGEHDGLPFFAMEFCGGGSLAQRIKQRPLPPREAAFLVEQIARGVAAAHARNIIHRDLKPSNVLLAGPAEDSVDSAGRHARLQPGVTPSTSRGDGASPGPSLGPICKVTDFGLAKDLNSADDHTRTGAILGTPGYMAPEQAFGQTKQLGPAADVYSIGATLYECLTGRPPFQGATMADTLDQVRNREPVPLRQLQPKLPIDLETIALKCLRKEPARRYGSAEELASDLRCFLEGRPILARPVSWPERATRWCRRNPLGALALALAALLFVGTIVAALWLKVEKDAAVEAGRLARNHERVALHAEHERMQQLFEATIQATQALRALGRAGQSLKGQEGLRALLDAVRLSSNQLQPQQLRAIRDEYVACLAAPDVTEVSRRPYPLLFYYPEGPAGFDLNVTLEPGAHLAWRAGRPEHKVRLEPLEPSGNESWHTRTLSPCGRWLLEITHPRVGAARLRVVAWEKNQIILDERLSLDALTAGFTADGRRLAIGLDQCICVFDLEKGTKTLSPPRFRADHVRFAANGRWLACNGSTQAMPIAIVDVDTWQTIATLPALGRTATLAWSPDGRELAVGTFDGQVYLWQMASGSGDYLPVRHQSAVDTLVYSADGRWLASSSWDRESLLWERGRQRPVLALPGRIVAFTGDGQRLAVHQEETLITYAWADAGVVRTLPDACSYAEFDPSGRLLATAGRSGVHLFAADSLAPLADLRLDPSGPPAFHPEGKELVTYGTFSHVQRWPIHDPGRSDDALRLGPPRSLPLSGNLLYSLTLQPQHAGRHAQWSRDGRLLALTNLRDSQLLLADVREGGPPRPLASLPVVRLALSPDGQWLAGLSDDSRNLDVYRCADGKHALRLGHQEHFLFSPDSRRLLVASPQRAQILRVGTWTVERTLERRPGGTFVEPVLAWRPDGRLCAVGLSSREIDLVEPDSGVVQLTLTLPEAAPLSWLAFDPGGTRLAITRAGRDVLIWDLARTQARLQEPGLAFADDLFPAGPGRAPLTGVAVERGALPSSWVDRWLTLATWEEAMGKVPDALGRVNLALELYPRAARQERAQALTLRGRLHRRTDSPDAARRDWLEALALDADQREAQMHLARLDVLGPAWARDPEHGLLMAWKLHERRPADAETLLILGVAYGRVGRWRDALATLDQLPAGARGPLAGYHRAICHARLGNLREARQEYAAARRAHDQLPLTGLRADETQRARREADEALDTAVPRPPEKKTSDRGSREAAPA